MAGNVGNPDSDSELKTPCASRLFSPFCKGFTRVHLCGREIVVFRSCAASQAFRLLQVAGLSLDDFAMRKPPRWNDWRSTLWAPSSCPGGRTAIAPLDLYSSTPLETLRKSIAAEYLRVQFLGANCRASHPPHHSPHRRHSRSVHRSNCLRIRSSLQRASEQYIGISVPLAYIVLTPARSA